MILHGFRPAALALACLPFLGAGPARASTDGSSPDWSLSEYGGSAADLKLLQSAPLGVLTASSPASILFIVWRRLHEQPVSDAAAAALEVPCCGGFQSVSPAVTAWLEARKSIPGAPPIDSVPTERPGPDYTSVPNCLDDAFRNATAVLQDRAGTHGATSPEVGFWLSAQDTVFRACAKPGVMLPVLQDAAPGWLRADYRYQSAALAFYNGDFSAATEAFAAIAQDTASPWHELAPYLRVRALLRRGLASAGPTDLVDAEQAAAAIPASNKLHAAATALGDMAQLHADPAAAAARLTASLTQPTLTAQAASDFKDVQSISARAPMPDFMDWIATIKIGAAAPPVAPDDVGSPLDRARAADGRRVAALAHARDRYSATHDPAWLLAILALMQPDDPDGGQALTAAADLSPTAPAYLTATYHRVRLTLTPAVAAEFRGTIDTVLARSDLTGTTRNLFLAERMLVATDLSGMAQFSLRARICTANNGCLSEQWGYSGQGAGLFDGPADTGTRGMGDDARYLFDRMALASRMALGADPAMPAPLQLDLALTNFARAVLVRDEPAVDALSRRLQTLLPVMASDFGAIPAAPAGAERQFAEFMIFAKIPGLRVDLLDYTRPTGAVADFGGSWPNWVVLAKPDPDLTPPAPVLYDGASYQVVDVPAGTALGDGHIRLPDVVCDGLCGAGGFVPHAPDFLADTAQRATAERRLLPPPGRYADAANFAPDRRSAFPEPVDAKAKPIAAPAGAIYVWDAMLDYATRHPRDPRVPEALSWLVHVGHYGQSHNHSGKRAFLLLKSRYPASPWAKQNQFYYD